MEGTCSQSPLSKRKRCGSGTLLPGAGWQAEGPPCLAGHTEAAPRPGARPGSGTEWHPSLRHCAPGRHAATARDLPTCPPAPGPGRGPGAPLRGPRHFPSPVESSGHAPQSSAASPLPLTPSSAVTAASSTSVLPDNPRRQSSSSQSAVRRQCSLRRSIQTLVSTAWKIR